MHCGKGNERPAATGEGKRERRKPGSAAGKVIVHDDFDDPLPDEMLELFHEGPILPDETPERDPTGGDAPPREP